MSRQGRDRNLVIPADEPGFVRDLLDRFSGRPVSEDSVKDSTEQADVAAAIRRLHTPTEVMYEDAVRRITHHTAYALGNFNWVGTPAGSLLPDQCHFSYPDPWHEVIVLEVMLATLAETFRFAWDWLCDERPGRVQLATNLERDLQGLRQQSGTPAFEPFTLRWRRLNYRCHSATPAAQVRGGQKAPGAATLLAAVQHPALIDKLFKEGSPTGWFISGITYTYGEPARDTVLYLRFCGAQTLRLCRADEFFLHRSPAIDKKLTIPQFEE
jgi:hypothetical protein